MINLLLNSIYYDATIISQVECSSVMRFLFMLSLIRQLSGIIINVPSLEHIGR